jgi:hypothetical protein
MTYIPRATQAQAEAGTLNSVLLTPLLSSYRQKMALQYKVFVTVGFENADYICDGDADHVEIQAALTAVNAVGGGMVYLKKGNYSLTNTSDITVGDNTVIVGAGVSTVLTKTSENNKRVFAFGHNGKLRDLKIVNQTAVEAHTIALNGDNFQAERIEVNGGQVAFYMLGRKNILVEKSKFYNYSNYAFLISNGNKHVQISECEISSVENTDGAYGTGYRGIYILNSSDVTIKWNLIRRHSARGVFVNRGSTNVKISGNTFEDNFHHVTIENDTPASEEGSSEYNTVAYNLMRRINTSQSSSAAIKLGTGAGDTYPSHYNIIESNIIINPSPSGGIRVFGGTGNQLISTTVAATNEAPIRIESEAVNTVVVGVSATADIINNSITTVLVAAKLGGQFVTPQISTGTAAPATTPTKVGDTFIDTTNGNIYIAKGTTDATDWVQVNN